MSFDVSKTGFILPDNWQLKRIGDIADINASTIRKDNEPQNIHYIDISSISTGSLEMPKFMDYSSAPSRAKRMVKEFDIVISTVRPNLRQYALLQDVGKNWVASTGFCVISSHESSYAWYLYSVITSELFTEHLIRIADGGTYPTFNPKEIENAIIPWPNSDGLKAINHLMAVLEGKINVNARMSETLEGMAQAIFKSWFVDFDPVRAKVDVLESGGSAEDARLAAMQAISGMRAENLDTLRTQNEAAYAELKFTAEAFPSAFTDSPLGPIPEGWEVKKIDDCYNVVMGQSPSGETYNETEDGTLFYQGRAEFGWRFPSPRLYTTDPKRMAKAGDILMSVRAPVGDMNIALSNCCIGRGLSALRHESGSTTFSYYQLKSIKSELDCFNGEGTVFGSINQKDLKNISVIAPSDKALKKFIEKCSALDEIILSSSLEIISLAETRDALLPKLLSGEINVSALNDTEGA